MPFPDIVARSLCHAVGTAVPLRWHGRANGVAQVCQ